MTKRLHSSSVTIADQRSNKLNIIRTPFHFDDELSNHAVFQRFFWEETDSSVTLPDFFYMGGDYLFGKMMDEYPDELQQILDEDWDLVVIDDLFWSLGFALPLLRYRRWEQGAALSKEPRFLVFATAGQTLMSAEAIKSTGRSWVSKVPLFPYIPTDESDVYNPAKFSHRLFSFWENFAELVLMNYLVESFFLPNIEKFGVPNFSWYEMYKRSSLQFSDSLDRLGWPLSVAPEVVGVGAHCKEPGVLPEEFRSFVEDPNSRGTIYIAFGTYPDWNYAPKRIIDALFGAFQRLTEYRIIFVYNGDTPMKLGQHIRLIKWAPQLELLAHPKTLAFITHGGMKSVKEAICGPVPMIVMPLFAEQAHNAHVALAHGFGKVINKYTLTADSVHNTILTIISDPAGSKRRAERLKAIFLDRPMPALDEGVFAIERLLRRPAGRKTSFCRQGMHLSWAQFYYAELAAIVLAFLFILNR